jgi:hypothetical protein
MSIREDIIKEVRVKRETSGETRKKGKKKGDPG